MVLGGGNRFRWQQIGMDCDYFSSQIRSPFLSFSLTIPLMDLRIRAARNNDGTLNVWMLLQ